MNVLKSVSSNIPIYKNYDINGENIPVLVNFDDLYVFHKRLGNGGNAFVKLYHDKRLGERVAHKEIYLDDYNKIKMVESEVQSLKEIREKIESNSVVKYYDSFIKKNKNGELIYVIVTEYIDGISLEELVENMREKGEVMDLSVAIKISYWLFDTIDKLHIHGYVHRDIKPGNIMVDTINNRFVLIDFGLTCSTNPKSVMACEAKSYFYGTYVFMPPESHMDNQHERKQNHYERKRLFREDRLKTLKLRLETLKMIDIWAAGVTIYYIIEGKLPWGNKNIDKTISKILNTNIEFNLSEPISHILNGALNKDPTKRMNAYYIKECFAECIDY